MILILEDDADREAFQRGSPFRSDFYAEEEDLRPITVWISPEAYREKVLADLRREVEALRGDEWADRRPVANGYRRALDDVLDLIPGNVRGGVNPPDPIFGHDHGQ
jgi:hypothetical protein